MPVLSFGTRLNARSWAEALQGLQSGFPAGWRAEHGLAGQHIVVDLSELGYADFVSLGHLLVFLHAAIGAGAGYSIRRPYQGLLADEDPQSHEAANRRIRRRNCLLYLEQSGFDDSLSGLPSAPMPEPEADSTKGPPRASASVNPVNDGQRLPHRRRKLVPYRWIPVEADTTQSDWAADLESQLADLGLSRENCAAIAKGVLAELVENGAEHSGAARVLLGAAMMPPETYDPRVVDFDASLKSFGEAVATTDSPLIRLVVADPGRGMFGLSGDPAAAIVDALNARPASSAHADGQVRARGLWKTARIIQGFRGSLLITTSGVTVSRVFLEAAETVAAATAPVAPGTLVECGVLLRAGHEWEGVEELITPGRAADHNEPIPPCTTATLAARGGFAEDDLERIRARLAGLPSSTSGIVVAVHVPDGGDAVDDTRIYTAISQVMAIIDESPDGATVAMVFPTINRPLLNVAIEHLNALFGEGAASHGRHPILVLAPDDRHFWVGGTPAIRRVLRALSADDEPRPLHELAAPAERGTTETARAVAELLDDTRLIHREGPSVSLRFRPRDAMGALAGDVGDWIRDGIEDETTDGTWHGEFLTPNLRVTTRWCNLDTILAHLQLEGLTGYTLAARVDERLGPFERGPRPSVILRLGPAPSGLMAALARSLTGRDEYFDSLEEMQLERETSEGAPPRVLVVTDLVSSVRTLTQTLTELVDREMRPIGVATVVDARKAGLFDNEPEEISFAGSRTPLVSLTRIDMEPKDPDAAARRAKPIDPIVRRPRQNVRLHSPDPLVEQDDYIAALKRSNAARLGHIVRPAARHYTAYVDPTRLFRDPVWERLVMDKLVPEIGRMRAVAFNDRAATSICILHPSETADELHMVAVELGRELATSGLPVSEVIAVPRAAHNDQWHLTDMLPLPGGCRHAVIIDASANSGRTLRQLIQLAADNGIDAINAVLLLNGLRDSEALGLQQAGTVRRSVRSEQSRPEAVQLAVHLVARTAMSGRNARNCAICALRAEYRSMPLLMPVPPVLEQHREWLVRALRPQSKPAAFQEQATDLFGANVSQDDCVAYLRWRFDLREADRDTRQRKIVAGKLDEAATDFIKRDALIRLLVAESHRLNSAPLWFVERRGRLADLITSLLTGDTALLTDQMLRVQAVILLAKVAPERFAEQLTKIMSVNRYQESVVLQALLEAFRLINNNAGTPHARDRVAHPLTQRLRRLESRLVDPSSAPPEPHASVVTRDLVRYLLSHGRRVLQPPSDDPQTAWASLRDHGRLVADHEYENAMWRVIESITLVRDELPPDDPDDLERVREDWAYCRDFLILEVLPHVARLRGPLHDGRSHDLYPADAERWVTAIGPDGPKQLYGIGNRIDALLRGAAGGGTAAGPPINPEAIEELLGDLRFWRQHFLRSSHAGSGLLQMIRRGPVDLLSMLRGGFPAGIPIDWNRPTIPGTSEILVFCTDYLLRDVFTHIRLNATETHHVDGAPPPAFGIELSEPDDGHVRVDILNTNSAPSDQGGHQGLSTRRTALASFGATLDELPVSDGWTFGISVTLQRWRMTP